MHFLGHVVRFIVSAIVLMIVGYIVPQFSVGGFWSALFLALVIAALGWIVEGIFGKRVSPIRTRYCWFSGKRRCHLDCSIYRWRCNCHLAWCHPGSPCHRYNRLVYPVSSPYEAGRSRHKERDL